MARRTGSDGLRRPAGSTANGQPRRARKPADVTLSKSAHLDALTKNDLMRLAGELQIDGHAAMSKPELITAIAQADGAHLGLLTKSELLRLARRSGSEVRASMTKDELIAAISESVPAA